MKKHALLIAALVATLALSGCSNLQRSGEAAIAADALSTTAGIQAGIAVEGNLLAAPFYGHGPWPVLALTGARIAVVEYMAGKPEPARTQGLALTNAVTWGAVANNVAVMVGLHYAAAIGIAAGLAHWHSTSDQRAFMELCSEAKKESPALACLYKGGAVGD